MWLRNIATNVLPWVADATMKKFTWYDPWVKELINWWPRQREDEKRELYPEWQYPKDFDFMNPKESMDA